MQKNETNHLQEEHDRLMDICKKQRAELIELKETKLIYEAALLGLKMNQLHELIEKEYRAAFKEYYNDWKPWHRRYWMGYRNALSNVLKQLKEGL